MRDLTISLENKSQKTIVKLITSNNMKVIEEITTYRDTNGTIFKKSIKSDVFRDELNLTLLKAFYYSQIKSLKEYYSIQGSYKFKINNQINN